MAQWSLISVCSEMKDTAALLKARKAELPLQKKMLEVLEFKLKSLQQISAADALELHKTLGECKFPEAMATSLAVAVDNLLGQQQDLSHVQSLKPQTIQNIHLFLTASEWKILDCTESAWWDKQKILVDRLIKLGFRSMSEQTVRVCVALLCCTLTTLPGDEELHQFVLDFKEIFHSAEKPEANLPYLVNFPDQPSGLPEQLLKQAFSNEDPPVPKDVPKLNRMKKLMVLRTSKKTLKASAGKKHGTAQASQLVSAEPFMAAPSQPSSQDQMINMMGMMCQVMQHCMGQRSSSSNSQNAFNSFAGAAQQFQPRTPTRAGGQVALQLTDQKSPGCGQALALPAPLPEGQEEASENKVAEQQLSEQQLAAEAQGEPPKEEKPSVEEELFEALKAKKQGLPAGSSATGAKSRPGKGKGKGKATGKAAAKAQAKSVAKGKVLKRPSAASSGLPAYWPAAPTSSQLTSRKACYVDNHYHKAKKVARDASLCEEDACLYARAARAKACETWDSAH